METEGVEQEIFLQPEMAIIGAVYSVNGYIGHVVLKTSDLENDSGYQTANDVVSAISTHNTDDEAHPYIQGLIDTKQDTLTAGTNVQISEQNVISATDTTYSAGNGISISGENAISVDTTIVATQQNLANEVTNRENADIALQAQIDGISASSDVVDIVGTYAELQQYDTQHLKDNDIVKVLQDETQGGATTYYRWSTTTSTFTLIGQEGPYYTKAAADSQFVPQTRTVNGKALSSNITLNANDVSALGTSDVVQTTGSSTSQVMSQNAVTTGLNSKLNASDYVVDTQLADSDNPVQNRVLNGLLGDMPSDFFSGSATTTSTASTELQFGNILGLDDMQLLGDTFQQIYSGKNLFNKNGTYITAGGTGESVSVIDTGIKVTYGTIGGSVAARFMIGEASSLVGKTITLSANVSKSASGLAPGMYIGVSNADLSSVQRMSDYVSGTGSKSVSWTVTEDNTKPYIMVALYVTNGGSPSQGDYSSYENAQLEIGSSPTSYEPYVGGTTSPNPDYPQDVQVVTGEQNVWVHGKNLFDKNTPFDFVTGNCSESVLETGIRITQNSNSTSANSRGVKIALTDDYIGKTLTLSCHAKSSVTTNRYGIYLGTCDENYDNRVNKISKFYTAGVSQEHDIIVSYTFANEDSGKYIFINFYTNNGSSVSIQSGDYVDYTNIQLEANSSPTAYEPYQSQYYTVDLGSTELCKIGTYQDYIYKSGDDWYLHKATGAVTFDGSNDENWEYHSTSAQPFRLLVSDAAQFTPNQNTPPSVFVNYYSPYYWNISPKPDYGVTAAADEAGAKKIAFRNIDITSLEDWLTWLGSNNISVYYRIATPTNTKITDNTLIGELEAVLGMSCYAGDTYVAISSSNLAGILELTAINANANGIIYKIRKN